MNQSSIDRAIADVSRPMRWPQAEVLAQKFSRAVIKRWGAMNRALFNVLREITNGESPAYATLQRKTVTVDKRNFTREDLNRLTVELANYFTLEQLEAIGNVFDTFSPDFFSAPTAAQAGIFNTYYPQVVADGYRESYERMQRAATNQGQLTLFNTVPEVLPVSMDTPFIRAFMDRGFRLVTSKITIDAKAVAFSTILEGLQARTPWADIAAGLFEKVGNGYLYHWKRLVRTEMTAAYYDSFIERYKGGEVSYVLLSLSVGACEKCIGLKGYYTLGRQPALPDSTHPNCRCVYVPYYRLPANVNVRD